MGDRVADANPLITRLAPVSRLPSTQQRRNRISAFKIRERVEFGYLQTQAWKSASPPRLLASYAADFVVVAGSARPSREFAVRPERLEAIELLQSLPGT